VTEQKRGLTRMQVERLLKAVDPGHVESKQGMSYMAQHQVRAELTRIFGAGNWDSQVEAMDLLWESSEEKGPKTMYRACYKARVRLTIRDYWGNVVCSFVEEHVEANSNLPDRGEAHAMAVTSVESYALRRAAIGLGDRLGLGLYDKGSLAPMVRGSLQLMDPESPLYKAPQEGAQPAEKNSAEGLARMQGAMKVVTPDAR
jgi:hypothetical protein